MAGKSFRQASGLIIAATARVAKSVKALKTAPGPACTLVWTLTAAELCRNRGRLQMARLSVRHATRLEDNRTHPGATSSEHVMDRCGSSCAGRWPLITTAAPLEAADHGTKRDTG